MNIVLNCVARLENHYIREYVEWYKKLGVNTILLWDNNFDGEDDFHDVIADYINSGFVKLQDIRNQVDVMDSVCQRGYDMYGQNCDWFMIFDTDELLEFEDPTETLPQFLSRPYFKDADLIRVCWKVHTDNGLVYVDNGDYRMYERFPEHCKNLLVQENRCTKSIIRGRIPGLTFDTVGEGGEHGTNIAQIKKAVNCSGETLDNSDCKLHVPDWRVAWLNHYPCKTMEEFCTIKKKRGYNSRFFSKERTWISQRLQTFYTINEITTEKSKLYYHYFPRDIGRY